MKAVVEEREGKSLILLYSNDGKLADCIEVYTITRRDKMSDTFVYDDLTYEWVQERLQAMEPTLDKYDAMRIANFILEVKFCAYSKGMDNAFAVSRQNSV